MSSSKPYNWQQETLRYDRPHPRLRIMAEMLAALPQRRILDVGCSTARLRKLLPENFDYFGCDLADHAAETLEPSHFRQLDLNASGRLSCFAECGIEVIHFGGVLEYLHRPDRVLSDARQIVGIGGRLVASIINFAAQRHLAHAKHHPAWVFKPHLGELRAMLAEQGWSIERQIALPVQRPGRRWLARMAFKLRGVDHPWTRRRAEQYVVQAVAV